MRISDWSSDVCSSDLKGAPDAILARSTSAIGPDGAPVPIDQVREQLDDQNDRLASSGMRVLAVAHRDLSSADWERTEDLEAVNGLTFLAPVGIVAPPRPAPPLPLAEAGGARTAAQTSPADTKGRDACRERERQEDKNS